MTPRSTGGNARKKQDRYDDGPWVKWPETDLTERALKFVGTYCRTTRGYGAGELVRMAPFQEDWVARILAPGVSSAVRQLTRGQGKSTFHAALATWALFDINETGAPQVPIMATRVTQAKRAVYTPAVNMIKREPELMERCLIYTGTEARVEVAFNDGEMFPISNDPDGLQGLDPSFALADEIGFQPMDSWTSLVLASGKRERSLVVGFGTPGFDKDNALWHIRSAYQTGGGDDGFIYDEIAAPYGCDHRDEAMWYLANPALQAGFQNIKTLRTNCATMPESEFRTFHLGQWVEGQNAWLGVDGRALWMRLKSNFQFRQGAPTWIGLDVSKTRDSTAMVFGQYTPQGKLHCVAKIWQPTPDQPINRRELKNELRRACNMYDVREIAYDNRFFEVEGEELADEGLPMTLMPQSRDRMAPAFGSLYESIVGGRLSHNGDRDFAAQILNGIAKHSDRDFVLTKSSSRGRIDAAYALAMMHSRAQVRAKVRAPLSVGYA